MEKTFIIAGFITLRQLADFALITFIFFVYLDSVGTQYYGYLGFVEIFTIDVKS